jgi:hypothetical protein
MTKNFDKCEKGKSNVSNFPIPNSEVEDLTTETRGNVTYLSNGYDPEKRKIELEKIKATNEFLGGVTKFLTENIALVRIQQMIGEIKGNNGKGVTGSIIEFIENPNHLKGLFLLQIKKYGDISKTIEACPISTLNFICKNIEGILTEDEKSRGDFSKAELTENLNTWYEKNNF